MADSPFDRFANQNFPTPTSIPLFITIALSISLTSAVFANIFLLARLLGAKDRLKTFCIIFLLSLHAIINVVCLSIFRSEPSGQQFQARASTAFVLSILSTTLGLFVLLLVIIDAVREDWYRTGEVAITQQQRSLNLAISWFIFVLIIGTVSFR